jgi:hypothetical protein
MNNNYIFKALPEYSFPSNFDITHALTLGTNYTSKRLKLSAGLNWNSGKPKTSPVFGNTVTNNEINYNATNSEQLQDYLRVDLSALYDFKLNKATNANLGISVWNLLNKKNTINNFYRLNNNAVSEIKQQSLGITPNVIFRVHF